ncbi:DNA integrity scanning diadenylate cyclase DisA [Aeromicrobium sp. UC242_57]|uniref:DNA integrity scanning diadenylate cyclase DisA n=1 Tax=Aeromicrobium sp. UC242_57 TaxID=3374624 RepID=UPI0037A2438A
MSTAAERHAASLDASTRMRATLSSVAPGTTLREGLERILRGRTGALIVVGHDKSIEAISTGGFALDVPFTATGLRELAKMDGAIILDKDASRIVMAGVHLMPDPAIVTEETGTRHRTADRVARQTGVPVISVSASMHIIALYLGSLRHVLEDTGAVLGRANQALQTLERYRNRLDEVSDALSALEIEDLVTVRDVAAVAQRLEMVSRIAGEIDTYVLELGSDGRLLALQLEEPIAGVDAERELIIRDYMPSGRRASPARGRARRAGGDRVDPSGRSRGRGPCPAHRHAGDSRRTAGSSGLPAARAHPTTADLRGRGPDQPLRLPAEAVGGQHRRSADRRRGRRPAGARRPRGAVSTRRVEHPRTLRLTSPPQACRSSCLASESCLASGSCSAWASCSSSQAQAWP